MEEMKIETRVKQGVMVMVKIIMKDVTAVG